MKNLSVENIYTRQAARTLTKKNFWRLLGMILLTGILLFALPWGGIYLLTQLTGAEWITTVELTSYRVSIDPATVTPAFLAAFAVLMLLVFLLSSGLNLGLLRTMTDIARGEAKVPVSRVFSRMKYCVKGLRLSIWVFIKTILWALPVIVLMLAVSVFLISGAYAESGDIVFENPAAILVVSALPLMMIILSFFLMLSAVLRYFLSTYVLADEPATGVFACVRKSKAMMKGHKMQLLKLNIPYLLTLCGIMLLIVILMMLLTTLLGERFIVATASAGIICTVAIMLVYALRIAMASCVFYLKRKGDIPAIPPEEEERIVAWQPAAERTVSESIAADAANISCWNPGGEVKREKE